ncbi:molybdopterin-dependent oxidoreductase [Haloarcula nitratireducens]|uniref:Molybdopterin-dependent oxidoreductase n=1 Tax=Haloarcula nitratireducens TaxID=2487749 RepID=A0AAW4PAJ6_9EURY|nr:molybdopterin-dependent oxidoreductase [Halomicroarcula nitratireducens]MBX0294833.1 molybdopterin-dependent oxidoreductase [Halomicroarcula nitratireducens]
MADDILDTRGGRALVSLVAAVAGLAGSYALTGYTPAFLVSPVERTLARAMPGEVVSLAITELGSVGQQLNLLAALSLTGAIVALAAWIAIAAGDAANDRLLPGVGTAVLTWGLAAALTGEFVLAAGPALAAAGVVALAQAFDAYGDGTPISSKRRRALSTVGVALGASVLGYSVGTRRTPAATAADAPSLSVSDAVREDIETKLALAEARSLDVDGLDSLVSETFYQVDINSIDPELDADDWSLSVTGAVEEETTLDYDELLSMGSRNQFSTLRCVGDSLNGKKMDTALWTGVPLGQLLDEAGVQSGCECVMLHAADDYFVEFPIEALRRGLLVYGMNGKLLPRGHGYPVRALVPGHWGEVNTKWVTEIEVLDKKADGYWERRGWEGTGPVKPIAKLHHSEVLDDGRRRLAGHAYAGLRGVSRVEVSTDGGESWADASLSEPLPSVDVDGAAEDAWRQWAYTYDPPSGGHTAVVRMVTADGTVQTDEETGPKPTGPSGWVSKEFS